MSPTDAGIPAGALDSDTFRSGLAFWLGEAHEHGLTIGGNWSIKSVDPLSDFELEVIER